MKRGGVLLKQKPVSVAPDRMPVKRDRGVANAFSHGFLLIWGILTAFPLLWAVLSSFKDDAEILSDPWGLPARLRFDNWVRAWNHARIGLYFLNSAIVALGGSVSTGRS